MLTIMMGCYMLGMAFQVVYACVLLFLSALIVYLIRDAKKPRDKRSVGSVEIEATTSTNPLPIAKP